jgi:ABC-type sugar transport system ATPase subunit
MISIRDLCVEIGDFRLKNANIDVADGEYMVLLGPTGAGKTVILESIAGLYPLKGGRFGCVEWMLPLCPRKSEG